MIKKFLILIFFMKAQFCFSEPMSSLNSLEGDNNVSPIKDHSKEVSGDKVLPPMNDSKIDEIIKNAQNTWREQENSLLHDSLKKEPLLETSKKDLQENVSLETELPAKILKKKHKDISEDEAFSFYESASQQEVLRFEKLSGQSITVFKSNLNQTFDEDMITLPSGAHAFGTVKFGEEVTAHSKTEVLLALDYAFLGPNHSVVELNGCNVWVSVESNFHTQKIKGSMQDLTCTMPSGRVFTVSLSGPLVEVASGYAGVESDLIMKGPAKAAAFHFLSEITQAYGAATAASQTRTELISSGENHSEKATNVTGEKKAFIEGKVIEAHGDFLKYIASFFDSLQPTLALPPGTKVHMINRFNVKIPKIFFKKEGQNHG